MWLCGRLLGCWSRRDRLEGEGEGGLVRALSFFLFFLDCGRRRLRRGGEGWRKVGGLRGD